MRNFFLNSTVLRQIPDEGAGGADDEAALQARITAAAEAETAAQATSTVVEDETESAETEETAETEAAAVATTEEAEPPAIPKAVVERIGELSADKRRLSEQLRAAQEELAKRPAAAAAEQQQDDTAPQRGQFGTEAEFNRAVAAEAQRQASVQEFNRRCNEVEDLGGKAFGDKWRPALAQLTILDDQGQVPLALIEAAIETENPATVLFELGKNIDRAKEIMQMTPVKRAIEIAKIGSKAPPPVRQSKAPAPIEPIRGGGAAADDAEAPSDKDDDATWNRKRTAQLVAQRRAREAAQ